MEFWNQLLQFMDTQMETPLPYGPFHLIWLAITVGLSLWVAFGAKKHSRKQVSNVLLVTAIAVMLLEIYKQINYTFGDGSGEPEYQWYAFPWQFCSTPMYVGLLAGLIRKGRVYESLCAYLATFGLFAGAAVMVYPVSVFIGTVGINLQTMICHGSMIVIGVYLLASGQVKLEHRSILRALPVFAVMVGAAVVMNEVAYRTGLLQTHTFNMFFISPYCEPSLPVYSLVQGVVPFPWCLVLYILGFTAAGYIMLLLGMGVKRLSSAGKNKKESKATV